MPERSSPRRARPRALILAFLASFALFATGAIQREIWRSDEHRYVEVAREMTTSPGGLWVPYLGGEIYVKKPPVYFWAVVAAHEGLGLGWDRAGVLPSAVATALTTAAVLALATPLYGPPIAAAAAFVFSTVSTVLSLSTRANLDALLAAFVTLSLLCYVRQEHAEARHARRLACALGGLFAGLGMMVKGPVALAFPAMVIATERLGVRGWEGLRLRPVALWLGVALVPGALWLAAAVAKAGPDYAEQLLLGHGIGHPLGLVNKQRPLWYYPKALLTGFLPWSLFLPAAAAFVPWRSLRRLRAPEVFTLAWSIVPLVVLSLFPAKRNVYLLPMYPGLSLWIAVTIGRAYETPREEGKERAVRLAEGACAIWGGACVAAGILGLVLAASAAIGWVPSASALERWRALVPLAKSTRWAALAVLCAGLVPLGWRAITASDTARRWRAMALSVGLAAWGMMGFLYPLESRGEAEAPFFRAIASRVSDHPLAWYGESDYSAHWTLGRDRVPILEDRGELEAFLRGHPPCTYLVAEDLTLQHEGMPDGVARVLEWPRPLAPNLVLLVAPADAGLLRGSTPGCAAAAPAGRPASRPPAGESPAPSGEPT